MQILVHALLYILMNVQSPVECTPPIVTSAIGDGIESITVEWLDFGNDTSTLYALEFVPRGEMPSGIPSLDSIPGDSTTVTGLNSGTTYNIFIRAVCTDGTSAWTGPVSATTFIDNDAACGIQLEIPDDQCPVVTKYHIDVDAFAGLQLGLDVYLSSVEMVISHPWIADLSVGLRSPSGAFTWLMTDRGVGVQNIGNPADSTCSETLTFSMSACDDLTVLHNGFSGEVVPEGTFGVFHDQGSAFGVWTLEICDKAADDIGDIRFVKLKFSENICDFPPVTELIRVLDTTALLAGIPAADCDTVFVTIVDATLQDTSVVAFPCNGEMIALSGLAPDHSYLVFAHKQCGAEVSGASCVEAFNTTCNYISLWSDFENTPPCLSDCALTCTLSDTIWSNAINADMDWIAFSGDTPTEFTGPDGSRFGGGRYLYIESSGDQCQNGATASIQSRCLSIRANDGDCDLSFWYHMYGGSIGTLRVEISTDGGHVWDSLWEKSGDQGQSWQQARISLSDYHALIAKLRIRATSVAGFLGDIAIDDIAFYGTVDSTARDICYFSDLDNDGYGDINNTLCLCSMSAPPGYTTDTTDCDDLNPLINPGADEIPCNLIDDNCSGEVDEGINPDPVTYELISLVHAQCTGINNGMIEISASGGTPPYEFSWTNGAGSSAIADLAPGMYQCAIVDSNGCITMTEVFEVEAEVVVEYFVVTVGDPSCQGRTDGFISGIVQGGTAPHSFWWSSGHTGMDISGLGNGTYQVTVTDAEGCSVVSQEITLKGPIGFTASVFQIRHVSCNGGNNGFLRIGTTVGAVPPIQYQWSNGDTTSMATNLSAGAYYCFLTDSIGCTLNAGPYFINQPSHLEAQVVSATPPLCNDGNDGMIDLSVNGGTPPYFYTWQHGPFSQDLSGLASGTYTVTIADLHGCDTIIEVILDSPDSLMLSLDSIVQVRCPADSSGVIALNATGGTQPYRFDWSYTNADTSVLVNVPPGEYSVTLSDASGCKATLHNLNIISSNEPLTIRIDSVVNVNCHGDSTGYVIAEATNGTGPFWFNWSAGVVQTSQTGIDTLNLLSAGMYQVTVTDAQGCTGVSDFASISQAPRLQFVLEQLVHNTCFGNATGVIDIAVSGGTKPYQFLWSSGDTTKDLRRLAAGMYQLLVTDSLGCEMLTPVFEVLQPDSVFIDFVTMNEDGNMKNGSAEVSITGGAPPYQFQWDTSAMSQTTPLAINLKSGVYTVTITDGDGCEYIDSVFVDRTTSISSGQRDRYIVYPNPAGAFVYIEGGAPAKPELYDMHGRRISVTAEHLPGDIVRLSVGHLSPGVYLLRVQGSIYRIVIGLSGP